jgi:biopolymer transport protein TolR
MAGVSTEHGVNGNKLDVDLNLVPFIDLLSTLVLFLLLTVIWVQVAAIPASVGGKGDSSVASAETTKLVITVKPKIYELNWPTSLSGRALPHSVTDLEQLDRVLKGLAKENKIPPASVGGDDQVEYGAVIAALDFLKSSGFNNISISTE